MCAQGSTKSRSCLTWAGISCCPRLPERHSMSHRGLNPALGRKHPPPSLLQSRPGLVRKPDQPAGKLQLASVKSLSGVKAGQVGSGGAHAECVGVLGSAAAVKPQQQAKSRSLEQPLGHPREWHQGARVQEPQVRHQAGTARAGQLQRPAAPASPGAERYME